MKIYISLPHKNREQLKSFVTAVKKLEDKGHKIIDVYKNEPFPQPDDVEYHVSKYKETERAIREADMLIVEATYPGRRQGYEIARGIDERKYVVALYDKAQGTLPTPSLVGNPSRYFSYRSYAGDEIDGILDQEAENAKSKLDTKFILIISPEIDKYLEWAASERRMHKAQIVRNSIEDAIVKDREYKEFLKDADMV